MAVVVTVVIAFIQQRVVKCCVVLATLSNLLLKTCKPEARPNLLKKKF